MLIGLGIALEPFPLIAFILILSAEKGTWKGLAFILGWLACLVAVIAAVVLTTGGKPPRPQTAPSTAALAVKLTLGIVLILLAVRQRRRMGRPRKPPSWMASLDRLSPWTAAGLAVFLQPWTLVAAGAATVVQAKLSTGGDYVTLVLFCLLGTSSFLYLELYAVFAPAAAAGRLEQMRSWLDAHQEPGHHSGIAATGPISGHQEHLPAGQPAMTSASPPAPASPGISHRAGESRWPMALAVLTAGGLRAVLPPALRAGDARWAFVAVLVALLAILIGGDPGRIDRDSRWLRALTGTLIGLISAVNASAAVRLVVGIIDGAKFSNDANILLASGGAIWLTNVLAFGLWYWDLDRGGAAARARGQVRRVAFVFPEMANAQYVGADWYPKFMDYLHLSFTAATAFSPTDVSAIKPWAKLMMMSEEAISLVVAVLVVSRAVNILK